MAVRVLVVHYSRSGRTQVMAEALAAALRADLEELREPGSGREGALGFALSAIDTLLGTSADLAPPAKDPSAYDLVAIGGPVWLHRPASPVLAYLNLQRDRLPRVAFFATYDWMGHEKALRRMSAAAGKAPVGQLALRRAELSSSEAAGRVARFAQDLLARIAPPPALTST